MSVLNLDWLIHAKIWQAGHASDWIAGWIGAGGAVLGSMVTVTWTEAFNQRARKRDRRARNATATFSVYSKINKIQSVSTQAYIHFKKNVPDIDNVGPDQWFRTAPFIPHSAPIAFDIDEKWAMVDVAGVALSNYLQRMDDAHNILCDLLRRYDTARQAIIAEILPNEYGPNRSFGFTDKRLRYLSPKFEELQYIIKIILTTSKDVSEGSVEAMRELVYARRRPLGKAFEVTMPLADGTTIRLRASDAAKHSSWRDLFAAIRQRLQGSLPPKPVR